MPLAYYWHRALGHLWWALHMAVERPLYWVPRTRRGDRVYDALWPMFGRGGGWCVDRASAHWRRARRTAPPG